MKLGVLMTEFPNQTSISMWRVVNALRNLGHDVDVLSTKKSLTSSVCHQKLKEEQVYYAWPPKLISFLIVLFKLNKSVTAFKYLFGLKESTFLEKLKLLPILFAGINLSSYCIKNKIEHVIVHSCANAAHLICFCRIYGGPNYSLRMGGDLDVYGKDHNAKFSNASFALPASYNNRDELLQKKLISNEYILPTWLGVNIDSFIPNKTNIERDENQLNLVTIARLNAKKGHEYILSAIKKLLDDGYSITYKIAGSGPYEAVLKQTAQDIGIGENVVFLGAVDEGEAIKLLQQSDVYVLASYGLGEASPVTVLEAMSCGLAVISSRIGGTEQMIIDDEDGILVPQKDMFSIYDSLLKLIKSPEELNRLGMNARKSAELYFGCHVVAKAITKAIVITNEKVRNDISQLSPINRKLYSNKII